MWYAQSVAKLMDCINYLLTLIYSTLSAKERSKNKFSRALVIRKEEFIYGIALVHVNDYGCVQYYWTAVLAIRLQSLYKS